MENNVSLQEICNLITLRQYMATTLNGVDVKLNPDQVKKMSTLKTTLDKCIIAASLNLDIKKYADQLKESISSNENSKNRE